MCVFLLLVQGLEGTAHISMWSMPTGPCRGAYAFACLCTHASVHVCVMRCTMCLLHGFTHYSHTYIASLNSIVDTRVCVLVCNIALRGSQTMQASLFPSAVCNTRLPRHPGPLQGPTPVPQAGRPPPLLLRAQGPSHVQGAKLLAEAKLRVCPTQIILSY